MVMTNAFFSREAVSLIKVIIWNEEPLMGFEMCPSEHSHICMQVLQLFSELIAPPPNATTEQPTNAISHFVLYLFLTQLH
jgi:hypothetical protein